MALSFSQHVLNIIICGQKVLEQHRDLTSASLSLTLSRSQAINPRQRSLSFSSCGRRFNLFLYCHYGMGRGWGEQRPMGRFVQSISSQCISQCCPTTIIQTTSTGLSANLHECDQMNIWISFQCLQLDGYMSLSCIFFFIIGNLSFFIIYLNLWQSTKLFEMLISQPFKALRQMQCLVFKC